MVRDGIERKRMRGILNRVRVVSRDSKMRRIGN